MFDLLGRSILFLLPLLGPSFKRKDQLNSGILRNIVIYQSVVISKLIREWERKGPKGEGGGLITG
jgi:hypothetical protein